MGKNLVWLTLDSIRVDRTPLGGHVRDTTPTLSSIGSAPDGFAGTCFSHAIWSQPSVASIMTATYPSTHGAGSYNETLPDEIPTVAERLSKAGYHTVGVSSNPYFSPTTGMDRGFDEFDFASGTDLAREAGLKGVLSFVRNLRTFSGGFEFKRRKHDANFLLNQLVKDRLRACVDRDDPFFLAAHYPGAHHPYYPSPKFRERFTADLSISPTRAAEVAFEHTTDVYSTIANGSNIAEDARAAIAAMYDAQVAQVDAIVGRLLDYIERIGLDDDTVLVVTSDHGDLLGEMGLFSHKLLLHDALIGVPIAVRGSERLSTADPGLWQHADVMTILLSELGADTSGMRGIELDRSTREHAVAQRGPETYEKTVKEVREYDPAFDHDHVFPGFVTAMRTEDWKFVSGDEAEALYELPRESEDVSRKHPDVVGQLRDRFRKWIDEHDALVTTEGQAEFDKNTRRLLADLGYVVD